MDLHLRVTLEVERQDLLDVGEDDGKRALEVKNALQRSKAKLQSLLLVGDTYKI